MSHEENTKPLHVRVAEALGWTEISGWKFPPGGGRAAKIERTTDFSGSIAGTPPPPGWVDGEHVQVVSQFDGADKGYCHVPDYDTDWSAGGPLIERYHLHLGEQITYGDGDTLHTECWIAGGWESAQGTIEEEDHLCGRGATPLLAVCAAILKLHAAGKLQSAE